jgi:hypothetical protein
MSALNPGGDIDGMAGLTQRRFLAMAASAARSAQSGLGRATCRRKTVTSCRSTRISASFVAS